MATRYELIIEKLDRTREEDRRVCNVPICACRGCAGMVGAKGITDRELEMYNSGEMQSVIDKAHQ